MMLKVWLRAGRLPFLTATVVPVVLGSVIAWYEYGNFRWLFFLLTLLGISFLHLGTNLANDYFDHLSGNDELNLNPTPFSGGSRVIQEGSVPAKMVLGAALISFIIGIMIGLYLVWQLHSRTILLLGIAGVFCGFFYTAAPFRIGYRGIGEAVVGFCFGPLVVLGAYYVQTGSFSLTALLASIPVGILILLVLYINEFPDYEADKLVNKNTLVVRLGRERAIGLYQFLLAFTYLYTALAIFFSLMPAAALLVFLALPLAVKAYSISRRNFLKIYELIPANAATVKLHLSFGLLLSAAFIVDKIFKKL